MSSETTIDKDKDEVLSPGEAEDQDDARDEDEDAEEERRARTSKTDPPRTRTGQLGLTRPSPVRVVTTIARREIAAYLNSALAYIVISSSLVLLGLYFFFYKGGFWQLDRATMTRMFEIVPASLLLLTIPLFTMRSLSDEKRTGTIELLITMPVRDSEVILGKYLASLTMVTMQIGLLIFYPIAMFTRTPLFHIGEFDWSPFWVGMFGLFLLSAAGVAVGMMFSSFTESQILSYFLTAGTLLILHFVGTATIVEYLQGWPGDVISFVSLQTRFEPFSRGLIDTRAIVFFLSIAILSLLVAFRALESRKWS
jgi:ABC-2 type transport system permease protein